MDKTTYFNRPHQTKIGIIGLGYVGLPLLVALAKTYPVIGYDINSQRVRELKEKKDWNKEITSTEIKGCTAILTEDEGLLQDCNFIIVTVPTPTDQNNRPNLNLLELAMMSISRHLKKGDLVVVESTVYPGVTEDVCRPILENGSKLVCDKDFFIGYSPERINPGDHAHTISNIVKVVSAQRPDVLDYMADVYGTINNGKIFKAKSIKTAEAAKAIENAQRDVNIAFINEATRIFNKDNISIYDVLDAAKTKWNFLDFKPGLVGGHCVSVDPYYLSFYAGNLTETCDIITSSRLTNEHMSKYVAELLINNLKCHNPSGKNILLLGFTFKENVNDTRNSKIYSLYNILKSQGFRVDVHDPLVSEATTHEYPDLVLHDASFNSKYDLMALCVPHLYFTEKRSFYLSSCLGQNGVVFDLKGVWKSDFELRYPEYKYITL